MTDFMIPQLGFISLKSELAEKSSVVSESRQCIINTARFCFEDTCEYISPEG